MKNIIDKIPPKLILGAALIIGSLFSIIDMREYCKEENQEKRRIQEQLNHQNSLRQEFKLLDLNNNAVIDSTEFIYRGEKKW